MRYVVLIGRILFSAIFIMGALRNFTGANIAHAVAQGVPLASIAVPLSGLLALAGGVSVLLGYKAKAGAWLLVLFLVPVTLLMHNFWAMTGPGATIHQLMFLKNLSALGGALLIAHFGSGPLSLDAQGKVS